MDNLLVLAGLSVFHKAYWQPETGHAKATGQRYATTTPSRRFFAL